jgi:hypothetical protein
VWDFGLFGHFATRLSSINPFVLTDRLFVLERVLILGYTGEAVLSPLSVKGIVLSLPSIMGTTVDPPGKDS